MIVTEDNDMPIYPMKLYLFNSKGKYDPNTVITICNEQDFEYYRERILKHVDRKLEVRITDPRDYLLFHNKDGQMVTPKL